jgi:hypothetical protein
MKQTELRLAGANEDVRVRSSLNAIRDRLMMEMATAIAAVSQSDEPLHEDQREERDRRAADDEVARAAAREAREGAVDEHA